LSDSQHEAVRPELSNNPMVGPQGNKATHEKAEALFRDRILLETRVGDLA
jgi:hypothetical protein